MKKANIIKQLLLILLLGGLNTSFAQDVSSDFGWTNTSGNTTSTTFIPGCNSAGINLTLTSSTLGHQLSGSGAIFPFNTSLVGDVVITLTFSQPVYNLRLLVNDFDEHAPGDFDDGTPSEYGGGFSPAFDGIDPVLGSPIYLATGGGTGVDPNGNENTKGWIYWDSPGSSITFTYFRPDASSTGGGWGLLLDSLSYDCNPTLSCLCSRRNKFNSAPTAIDASGETTAVIHLNSDGVAISKLNISIPNYTSFVDPSCMVCDPENMSTYGKITNLPTIAGVTPTYVGAGGGLSTEIVYLFDTPTVINHIIDLDLQFPPVLELSCCRNRVNYCINIGMIDAECTICEAIICNGFSTPIVSMADEIGSTSKSNHRTLIEQNGFDNRVLTIHPNPAMDYINIELPAVEGMIYIYTVEGDLVHSTTVNSKNTRINTTTLTDGSYIVKHINGNETIAGKFIKN